MPLMNLLTLFGLFAVTAMLVFYALEEHGAVDLLGFACARVLGSIYGFLQGAWPFSIVEAVWAAVSLRRSWLKSKHTLQRTSQHGALHHSPSATGCHSPA